MPYAPHPACALAITLGGGLAADLPAHAAAPATPIEHVIVVVGENRTFDNLFATYVPPRGQTVANLLAKGIVRADGSPGPNFALAQQRTASSTGAYTPTPSPGAAYPTLPPPYAAGAVAQPQAAPDPRFPATLPNGPFPITRHVGYGAHTGDPVHRFFQMWQQVNGGRMDLFAWVAATAGAGPNNGWVAPGAAPGRPDGVAMGFYNMAAGDAPYFKRLAERYAIADNYHQSVMGGTTANYFALATGDVAVFEDEGRPAVPPPLRIENPDARPGTDNVYVNDGYDGGAYVACADESQPGVAGIRALLRALPYRAFRDGNCEPGAYYLVNNLDPAYTAAGELKPRTPEAFAMTPQSMPHIGDALSAAGVSWAWYSGGRGDGGKPGRDYCATCDVPVAFRSTMTGPDRARLLDLSRFYADVKDARRFPAVAFIAPYDTVSGHPGYSAQPSFEHLVQDIVTRVQANPALWRRTAILVTYDEGGGYYDSASPQFIDFFGDGTRVPLIVVSPHARRGFVDHTYHDHASILKFIQRNWGLAPLSARSRDNLPNPVADPRDPYVPANRPAIGDLMTMFRFAPPARRPTARPTP